MTHFRQSPRRRLQPFRSHLGLEGVLRDTAGAHVRRRLEPTASVALASVARPSLPCWWCWRASAPAASALSSLWRLASFEPRVKHAPDTWTTAGLTWTTLCRLVGHFGAQEDHMDLHTVHVESHLMAPEMEVSMTPPLEDHGLTTITVDSTLAELPPQPPPPE
ncbi:transmembrane protein 210 [Balaenoptera acutorostrata]|uniref:Transmembrane protein 210 n=1 Tax=Balaenoptera acutorostrata TaxID=9767 RepID=A0ABM3TPJ7_BALAC|nr:transmembrane protein 210 [Balaenoptera acutorostrata]